MAKLTVLNKEGKTSGSIELPDDIFTSRVNTHVIHQALVMYHASQRQGNASTKQRAEVRGGGKKPWRQKGTGRSRHGSSRSPLWRGGGTTFGPLPKNYSYDVPKKIRQEAFKASLNAKYQSKNLTCLEDVKENLNKTKEFALILSALKIEGSVLAVMDGCSESIHRVIRNIASLSIKQAGEINAFDIVRHKVLLASRSGFENLLKRVQQ